MSRRNLPSNTVLSAGYLERRHLLRNPAVSGVRFGFTLESISSEEVTALWNVGGYSFVDKVDRAEWNLFGKPPGEGSPNQPPATHLLLGGYMDQYGTTIRRKVCRRGNNVLLTAISMRQPETVFANISSRLLLVLVTRRSIFTRRKWRRLIKSSNLSALSLWGLLVEGKIRLCPSMVWRRIASLARELSSFNSSVTCRYF